MMSFTSLIADTPTGHFSQAFLSLSHIVIDLASSLSYFPITTLEKIFKTYVNLTDLKNSLKTDTMTPSGLTKMLFFSFLLEARQIQ